MQITKERRQEIITEFVQLLEKEIVRGEQFKRYYEAKMKVQKEKEAGETKLKLGQVEDAIAFNTDMLNTICE